MFYTYESTEDIEGKIRERIRYRQAIFHWCLRNAHRSSFQGNFEGVMQWARLAADIASVHCEPLVSPELETHLLAVSTNLPPPPPFRKLTTSPKKCYLHVVTCALPSGGHTAMMHRWVELDREDNKHSIITLEQKSPVPASLAHAIAASGGEIIQLKHNASLMTRASILRHVSCIVADTVILHVHPQDVITTAAFGVEGGPPVLFVNHGAHKFWVGGAISDLVLNCRGSELENTWTVRNRGIQQDRSKTLPIPLISPKSTIKVGQQRDTNVAKSSLGLPPGSTLLLTVGDSYKYTPLVGIDFLSVVQEILEQNENLYLFAIGVDKNEAWSSASSSVGGRIKALGRRDSLNIYHDAADLYIEGFPFGSTTALLEAGLKGIPCVLAPNTCPPPFTSDGLALDWIAKPQDLQQYKNVIEALITSEYERTKLGSQLSSIIARHHTGTGWSSYLEGVKKSAPPSHRVYNLVTPESVPAVTSLFWASFWHGQHKKDEFLEVYQLALTHSLSPRLDLPLIIAIQRTQKIIKRNSVFNGLLKIAYLFAYLFPAATASRFWCHNLFFYLRDDGLIMRILQNLSAVLRGLKQEEPAE